MSLLMSESVILLVAILYAEAIEAVKSRAALSASSYELIRRESELLYDWLFTANQFALTPSPLRITARIFFLNWTPAAIVLK
jgi:hypothetical protein